MTVEEEVLAINTAMDTYVDLIANLDPTSEVYKALRFGIENPRYAYNAERIIRLLLRLPIIEDGTQIDNEAKQLLAIRDKKRIPLVEEEELVTAPADEKVIA